MKFTPSRIYEEVSFRLEGAAGPGSYLKRLCDKRAWRAALLCKEYLDNYLSEPSSIVPGCNYCRKLQQFIDNHCRKGESILNI